MTIRGDLEHVRCWAKAKIDTGNEPPWAWYQYMKLVETIDAIVEGQSASARRWPSLATANHPVAHTKVTLPM
jgi:hypothetical protein